MFVICSVSVSCPTDCRSSSYMNQNKIRLNLITSVSGLKHCTSFVRVTDKAGLSGFEWQLHPPMSLQVSHYRRNQSEQFAVSAVEMSAFSMEAVASSITVRVCKCVCVTVCVHGSVKDQGLWDLGSLPAGPELKFTASLLLKNTNKMRKSKKNKIKKQQRSTKRKTRLIFYWLSGDHQYETVNVWSLKCFCC